MYSHDFAQTDDGDLLKFGSHWTVVRTQNVYVFKIKAQVGNATKWKTNKSEPHENRNICVSFSCLTFISYYFDHFFYRFSVCQCISFECQHDHRALLAVWHDSALDNINGVAPDLRFYDTLTDITLYLFCLNVWEGKICFVVVWLEHFYRILVNLIFRERMILKICNYWYGDFSKQFAEIPVISQFYP